MMNELAKALLRFVLLLLLPPAAPGVAAALVWRSFSLAHGRELPQQLATTGQMLGGATLAWPRDLLGDLW